MSRIIVVACALAVAIALALPGLAVGREQYGLATWYCLPGVSRCTAGWDADDMAAAVLPGTYPTGAILLVCTQTGASHCIRVKAVDCLCAHAAGVVIDLYASQFARLEPLSRGELRVSVTRWH